MAAVIGETKVPEFWSEEQEALWWDEHRRLRWNKTSDRRSAAARHRLGLRGGC